jgi:hypothetical protein
MDMTEFHEVKAKAGTEGKGLSETASKHGSTRGRGGEYVTGSEFTAVLELDSSNPLDLWKFNPSGFEDEIAMFQGQKKVSRTSWMSGNPWYY